MFTQMAQSQTKSCHQPNSFLVVTIKETSWGGSNKFEDIAFENTQTFSVPNGKIQLVPFNDCRWEESVFEKFKFNFNKGNRINISRSIKRCFFSGIKLKRHKFCKTLLIFCTIVVIEVILTLALGKSLWRSPVLRQLLPNMLSTEWTLVFVEKTN